MCVDRNDSAHTDVHDLQYPDTSRVLLICMWVGVLPAHFKFLCSKVMWLLLVSCRIHSLRTFLKSLEKL